MEPRDDPATGAAPGPTDLLLALRDGGGGPSDRLLAALYAELRRLARRQLARERRGHTLQTTALVHEAWLRLIDQTRADWRDREHFLAVACTVMRRVLVDYARRRLAGKRAHERVTLTAAGEAGAHDAAFDVIDLDRALARLAGAFPRPARVVELRYFGGLGFDEIAAIEEITDRTAQRDWAFARAWLARELGAETEPRKENGG